MHELTPRRISFIDELVRYSIGQDANEKNPQRGLIAFQVIIIKIDVFLPLKSMIE